jgi:hypothetical protein
VHPERVNPVIPTVELDGKPFQHQINVNLIRRTASTWSGRYGARLELARRYAWETAQSHRGADAAGVARHPHDGQDVRRAAGPGGGSGSRAALNDTASHPQMGMLFPMEPRIVGSSRAASGNLVVEEKRGFLELFARRALRVAGSARWWASSTRRSAR